MAAKIHAIYRGQPKTLHDDRGEWVSSIARERVDAPLEVFRGGLAGDRVAQPYHGSSDAAICLHLCDHYRFWNQQYGLHLRPGAFGENLVLDEVTEDEIFVGDIVRTGTALLQVSGPRIPCANLARHVGRSDWVKLTIQQNRTGFYARVLEPGTIRAGDAWTVEDRPNTIGSIPAINRCIYLNFDPDFARQVATLSGLGALWKQQFQERLEARQQHWSETIAN